MPLSAPELIAEADRALAQGRLDEAERLCGAALRQAPESREAGLRLGIVYVKTGRFAAALPLLQRVAREGADDSPAPKGEAPLWLSRALRRLGRPAEALEQAIVASERAPEDPSARYQLGLCLLDAGRYAEAADGFERALAADPDAAPILHGLGLALEGLGRRTDAIDAFRRAAARAPGSIPTLTHLWQAAMDGNLAAEAVDCARTLLKLQSGSWEAHYRLGQSLLLDGKLAEAEAQARLATRIAPTSARAASLLGTVLQADGEIEEAVAAFRRSLQLTPDQGAAHAAIAYSRKVREEDRAWVETMRALARRDRLPPAEASPLHYALGKASEDLGEYEAAMRHFDRANRAAATARFAGRRFDRELYAKRIDSMIETFDRDFLRRHESVGSESEVPIFVVGMIRSGTTLVEQILSSHPEVGAAGEQSFWLDHRNDVLDRAARTLDAEALGELARRYVALLQGIAPGKGRVVDKMPDNYLELPTLHLALPRAKILHIRRNPVDTCVSIYTTLNRLGIEWIHDKADIVFVYREYQRLMERWRSALPAGAMMELDYEELVSTPERVTRAMVAFCGLAWNDACLRPENNRRVVSTPSLVQVRQPVYTTSVDRWRRYEPWLGAFAELA